MIDASEQLQTSLRLLRNWVLTLASLYPLVVPNPAHGAIVCNFAVSNIVFGNIEVITGGAVDSTATLEVKCSGAPVDQIVRMCVSISGGVAWDGTSRLMNGSGLPQLRYQLYSDAARTAVWGSWPAGLYGGGVTWDIKSDSTDLGASKTIYGRVHASQQLVSPGNYSSTLSLFVTYQKDDKDACPDPGAGSATTSFLATATVLPSCTVEAKNLNFGTSGTLASNIDAASSIGVACSNGLPYQVGLSAGNGIGATVSNRKMTLGAATVGYALYSNSGRTTNWGNTVGTDTVGGTGAGSAQTLTVYGTVPPQSTPAPGTYNDTIVVTVTY